MSVFTWRPDRGPSSDVSFAVVETKFGDGYRQIAPNGINSRSDSWSMTFTGLADKIGPLKSFLDARGGFEPFTWTNPNGEVGRYLASKYSLAPLGNGVQRITVTFDQDFTP